MDGHKWVGINGKILGRFWHFQGFLKISITGGRVLIFARKKCLTIMWCQSSIFLKIGN